MQQSEASQQPSTGVPWGPESSRSGCTSGFWPAEKPRWQWLLPDSDSPERDGSEVGSGASVIKLFTPANYDFS